MAFRHCVNCQEGLDKPTPREDLSDGQQCPYCGHEQPQYMTQAEWIIDLFDELKELKASK